MRAWIFGSIPCLLWTKIIFLQKTTETPSNTIETHVESVYLTFKEKLPVQQRDATKGWRKTLLQYI